MTKGAALFFLGLLSMRSPAMARDLSSIHASLKAYPAAVISAKDSKTNVVLFVESNGRRLAALDKDGAVLWDVDVIAAAKVEPPLGSPVIRHLRIQGDFVWVTYGKSDTAKVDLATGKTEYFGRN